MLIKFYNILLLNCNQKALILTCITSDFDYSFIVTFTSIRSNSSPKSVKKMDVKNTENERYNHTNPTTLAVQNAPFHSALRTSKKRCATYIFYLFYDWKSEPRLAGQVEIRKQNKIFDFLRRGIRNFF